LAARTLAEVRTSVAAGATAQSFASGFADAYFAQALGVLPKTEIDLLVFRLLAEEGVIDADGSVFQIARALNITPAKARNLLFQYQLRFIEEAQIEQAVLKLLASARFWVDGTKLNFGVESPLARATIDGRLKSSGVFADISLSGDILRLPLGQFAEFITLLLTEEKAKALEDALRKAGHLKSSSLNKALNSLAGKAIEGVAKEGGKQLFGDLFSGLREWTKSGDGALSDLGSLFDSVG
jgi:hypothetical protein